MPSTFHHSATRNGGRRITTSSFGDISESLAQHLNKPFPPLKFLPVLALRVLTHLNHHDSVTGHNSRSRFSVGLRLPPYFYLSVSLHSCHRQGDEHSRLTCCSTLQCLPAAVEHDHSRIATRVLNTLASVNTLLLLLCLPAAVEDYSGIAARVLNAHSLGEYVAPHWRL